MKRIWMAGLSLGLFASGVCAQNAPEIKSKKDQLSYAVGVEMGEGIKDQGFDVDPNLLILGLKDALSGANPKMSEDDRRAIISEIQAELKKKETQEMEETAAINKKEGEAFLAENKKKDGVITLPSGLQYKVITAGQGKKPAETDTVLCNYRGTFIDGQEFDHSTQGKPASLELKGIVPGFKEALMLMPVGSKWQLVIPPNLAFGDRGAGNVIGPDTTVVFEVELVSIQPAP